MTSSSPREPRTLPEIMADYERIIIIRALHASGGSRSQAARSLGIRRGRLYARIRALKLDLVAVTDALRDDAGQDSKSRRNHG